MLSIDYIFCLIFKLSIHICSNLTKILYQFDHYCGPNRSIRLHPWSSPILDEGCQAHPCLASCFNTPCYASNSLHVATCNTTFSKEESPLLCSSICIKVGQHATNWDSLLNSLFRYYLQSVLSWFLLRKIKTLYLALFAWEAFLICLILWSWLCLSGGGRLWTLVFHKKRAFWTCLASPSPWKWAHLKLW